MTMHIGQTKEQLKINLTIQNHISSLQCNMDSFQMLKFDRLLGTCLRSIFYLFNIKNTALIDN